jgi:extradiol dioxygenase family protein
MFKGKSDHIVFACADIASTRHFYEAIVGLSAETAQDDYVTYDLGGFFLCFRKALELHEFGKAVKHIGIDLPLRSDVDALLERIKGAKYPIESETIGGLEQGPYRFYVKDPSGYTIEFESWDGCSN